MASNGVNNNPNNKLPFDKNLGELLDKKTKKEFLTSLKSLTKELRELKEQQESESSKSQSNKEFADSIVEQMKKSYMNGINSSTMEAIAKEAAEDVAEEIAKEMDKRDDQGQSHITRVVRSITHGINKTNSMLSAVNDTLSSQLDLQEKQANAEFDKRDDQVKAEFLPSKQQEPETKQEETDKKPNIFGALGSLFKNLLRFLKFGVLTIFSRLFGKEILTAFSAKIAQIPFKLIGALVGSVFSIVGTMFNPKKVAEIAGSEGDNVAGMLLAGISNFLSLLTLGIFGPKEIYKGFRFIGDAINSFIDTLVDKGFSAAFMMLADLLPDGVKQEIMETVEGWNNLFGMMGSAITGFFGDLKTKFLKAMNTKISFGAIIKTLFRAIFNGLLKPIGKLFKNLLFFVVENAFKPVASFFNDGFKYITDKFSKAFEFIKNLSDWLSEKAEDAYYLTHPWEKRPQKNAQGQNINYDESKVTSAKDTAKITSAETKEGMSSSVKYLVEKKGLTPIQAAGIVGNLAIESGMSTTAEGDKNVEGGSSVGLAQWREGRKKNLLEFLKKRGKTLETSSREDQLDFLMHEMNSSDRYKQLLEDMKGSSSVADASNLFTSVYEVPAEATAHREERVSKANLAAQMYTESKEYSEGTPIAGQKPIYVDPMAKNEKPKTRPQVNVNRAPVSNKIPTGTETSTKGATMHKVTAQPQKQTQQTSAVNVVDASTKASSSQVQQQFIILKNNETPYKKINGR